MRTVRDGDLPKSGTERATESGTEWVGSELSRVFYKKFIFNDPEKEQAVKKNKHRLKVPIVTRIGQISNRWADDIGLLITLAEH